MAVRLTTVQSGVTQQWQPANQHTQIPLVCQGGITWWAQLSSHMFSFSLKSVHLDKQSINFSSLFCFSFKVICWWHLFGKRIQISTQQSDYLVPFSLVCLLLCVPNFKDTHCAQINNRFLELHNSHWWQRTLQELSCIPFHEFKKKIKVRELPSFFSSKLRTHYIPDKDSPQVQTQSLSSCQPTLTQMMTCFVYPQHLVIFSFIWF